MMGTDIEMDKYENDFKEFFWSVIGVLLSVPVWLIFAAYAGVFE